MNSVNRNIMMRTALRCGVSLFMLSGAFALSLQAQEVEANAAVNSKTPKKNHLPTYVMKEVSGVVFDAATKQPLAGVRIQAFNNANYTAMTDEQGKYTIKVPEHITTLFAATDGYNGQQIGLHDTNNFYLQSNKLKAFYNNSFNIAQSASLGINTSSALSVENDLENALHASVRTNNRGGLPAQGATMFINGINSLNANAQPLVVVDGVVWDMQNDRTNLHDGFYNNILNLIDTEDIEHVEVIRNGTAIYGAEGANGVLKITTKRGKSMATRISIRAYGGVETMPNNMSVMNADQFRNYVVEFLGTTPIATAKGFNSIASNMTIPFLNEDKNYLYYNQYHANTDWQKDLYQTAFTQNYRVGVQGGDEIAMYNLSLGYSDGQATAKNNDFNRLNIRFNTDVKITTKLTTEIDMAYVRNAYSLRDNGWAESYSNKNISSPGVLGATQTPFVDPYAWFVSYKGSNQLVLVHTDKVLTGIKFSDQMNPLAFAKDFGYEGLANPYWVLQNGQGENKNSQEQTQFLINIAPRYQFNKYLALSNRFAYTLNRSNEKYFMPYNGTPEKEIKGLGNVNSIIGSQFAKETTIFNDLRLTWSRNYGKHQWDVYGGFRMSTYGYSSSNVLGYNNLNDKMPNLHYGLQYLTTGGVNDNWTNLNYYANVDYNYLNRYYLRLITSTQASSRFGTQTEDGIKLFGVKWGLFPSLQAAWVMSNESWFNFDGIDYAKVYAGYDISGNDNVNYYAARTYFANVKFLDKATALELSNIQNPKIQWETTYRFNAGFLLNMLRNRLSVGFEYFNANTQNLLTRKNVSDITGVSQMWANDGALNNHGVNLSVDAVVVNHKDFKWQLGATVGHYKNRITALPTGKLNTIETYALDANGMRVDASLKEIHGYTSSVYGQDNILTTVGQAAGVFYGYQTDGVYSTTAQAEAAGLKYPTGLTSQPSRAFKAGDVKFVDQNGDGWINEADKVIIGDPNPDIFGNIYTTFNYKRLTLGLYFKYALGNEVYNYNRMQMESANNVWNQSTAVVNRWRREGQITHVPRTMSPESELWVNNERFSDRWIEDGSYLKLKKVRLTYDLPLSLSWLQGLTIWGEANNVFTISKYLGNDPEVTAGNAIFYQGIDAGYLNYGRSFNLGVTINL